ncbi:MAG: hypothetical protein WB421_00350, partial [Terriglobales bacterium]
MSDPDPLADFKIQASELYNKVYSTTYVSAWPKCTLERHASLADAWNASFPNNPLNLNQNFFLNDILVFDMSAVNADAVVASFALVSSQFQRSDIINLMNTIQKKFINMYCDMKYPNPLSMWGLACYHFTTTKIVAADAEYVIFKQTQYFMACLTKTIVESTKSIANPTQLQLLVSALLILLILNFNRFDDSDVSFTIFAHTFTMTPGMKEVLNEWWGPGNVEWGIGSPIPIRLSALFLSAWLSRLIYHARFVCLLTMFILQWQQSNPPGLITTSWVPASTAESDTYGTNTRFQGGFVAEPLT